MIFSNKFGEGRTLWINSMRQCDLGDNYWHTHHLAKYGGEPSEVQARPPEEEEREGEAAAELAKLEAAKG